MNPSSRRVKLEAMLESSPADSLLRYMLAIELDKEGQHELSLGQFETLMSAATPYVPAFLMAGQMLTRIGRSQDAVRVYNSGIAAALQQQDAHAAGEMNQFLIDLQTSLS